MASVKREHSTAKMMIMVVLGKIHFLDILEIGFLLSGRENENTVTLIDSKGICGKNLFYFFLPTARTNPILKLVTSFEKH